MPDARSTANVVTLLASAAALLLVSASLLLRHDRRAIARVGRRTAFLALVPVVVLEVLPRVLAHASSSAPQIASALLRVYGDRVLPSAITLIVAGIAIFVGAYAWPRTAVRMGRSGPDRPASYTGPVPSRAGPPDRPEITDRLYL